MRIKTLAACAVVIRFNSELSREEVLVVSRKSKGNDFGLPGGGFETTDSSTEETAVRELLEETNLKAISPPVHLYTGKEGKSTVSTFLIPFVGGEIVPEQDSIVKWMSWDEFLSQGSFKDYNIKVKQAYDDLTCDSKHIL